IAREQSLWFHVDGAYGAFFNLTERGKARLRGIGEADSVILDPHKTLFLPFGTGALLVKDARLLRAAHSSHADYLPEMQDADELVDFCELSPELSRDFRGLRVWLPLKLFGIEPFRQQLDEKLDLIAVARDGLAMNRGLRIVAEPELSTLAFRIDGSDRDNRELLERVNRRKRVMLTSAVVKGEVVIRVCIVSHRTHRERIDMLLEDVREELAKMA